MKKKKLKTLSLKKASISNLNGGIAAPSPGPLLTIDIRDCLFTYDIRQCTWYSELNTACECDPSWDLNCNSNAPVGCADSVRICLL
ncbi:hypothetical protein [Kordia sp.]|uniref:hypothetical protein n=1 Tax=Kordia sp. TaxID=1965332 RepID=UPI003D2C68CF